MWDKSVETLGEEGLARVRAMSYAELYALPECSEEAPAQYQGSVLYIHRVLQPDRRLKIVVQAFSKRRWWRGRWAMAAGFWITPEGAREELPEEELWEYS